MQDASLDISRAVLADLHETAELMAAAAQDRAFVDAVAATAAAAVRCLQSGGKVLFAGNGGSAADAQHLAGEFISRFNYDRAPLAAIALTTDSSILTAIGNDYGYVQVFSRQVRGLGRPGDLLVAISTSGNSPNILAACEVARDCGMVVAGLTGASGGKLSQVCDIVIRAPSTKTPFIQQLHITAGHSICAIVERAMFPLENLAAPAD